MRPCQLRYYTRERESTAEHAEAAEKFKHGNISREIPCVLGALGGEKSWQLQATPCRCANGTTRSCIRLGPRLRTRRRRIRSSKSAGAYLPLARKTSACESWS